MPRRSRTRELAAWMNGERVGTWTLRADGAEEFAYADAWLASAAARPISLSMPLGPPGTRYRGDVVHAYFDNLLPDTRNLREAMQRRFGAASTRPIDLLAEAGRDCAGAVQLMPDDEPPPDVRRIVGRRLTEGQIETQLERMQTPALARADEEEFRLSLAGAQEKSALLRHQGHWMRPLGTTPTTHILKLPIGRGPQNIDLSASVENEWLCARILRAYGVPVANCEMAYFGEQRVLIVERFDRRRAPDDSWIVRLPQEDFCQVTGTPSDRKYESDGGPGIQTIMTWLLGSAQAAVDRRDFLRTQILFWMLCAIDGHAKNFSLFIEPGGRFRLTPRYDVLSAYPMLGSGRRQLSPKRARMAMFVHGARRHDRWDVIQRRHWEVAARHCAMAAAFPELIDELIARTPAAIEEIGRRLPLGFPEAVAKPILDGLERAANRLAEA